jgi:hypothetical protein
MNLQTRSASSTRIPQLTDDQGEAPWADGVDGMASTV